MSQSSLPLPTPTPLPIPTPDITRRNITDYTSLIVHDYLQSKGYLTALDGLTFDINNEKQDNSQNDDDDEDDNDDDEQDYGEDSDDNDSDFERKTQQNKTNRRVNSWYTVNERLNLVDLLEVNRDSESKRFNSILEVLLSTLSSPPPPPPPQPAHTPTETQASASPTSPIFSFPMAISTATKSSPNKNKSETSPTTSHSHNYNPPTSAYTKPKLSPFSPKQQSPRRQIKKKLQPQPQIIQQNNNSKNISSSNWIPDTNRLKMLRRDLTISKHNIEITEKHRLTTSRESSKPKLNPLDKSKTLERYGLVKREDCGLCLMSFYPVNLVLSVPLKAVLDIRSSWGTKFDSSSSVTSVQMNSNLRKAPLCYNDIKVCTFCSQLFTLQQDIYRPSYESKELEMRRVREEESEREREAFWDPLKTMEDERLEETRVMIEVMESGGGRGGGFGEEGVGVGSIKTASVKRFGTSSR